MADPACTPDLDSGVSNMMRTWEPQGSDASTKAEELGVQGGASSRAKFPAHHESVALPMDGNTVLTRSLIELGAVG